MSKTWTTEELNAVTAEIATGADAVRELAAMVLDARAERDEALQAEEDFTAEIIRRRWQRARIEGQIEGLEFALEEERLRGLYETTLPVLGNRLAELHQQLEKVGGHL